MSFNPVSNFGHLTNSYGLGTQHSNSGDTGNISAVSLFKEHAGDFIPVLKRCQEIKVSDGIDSLECFISHEDSNGKTFFHHLMEDKHRLEYNSMKEWNELLGDDLFSRLMEIPDKSGVTPLGIAIERGQMALVALLFPIPPPKIVYQPLLLENALKRLTESLSNNEKRRELMDRCPGEMYYDKVNHILSALHAISSNGHGELLKKVVEELSPEERSCLPYENRNLLKKEDSLEILSTRIKECESLATPEDVIKKIEKWKYQDRPTNVELSYDEMVTGQENPLLHLINISITHKDEQVRNAYFNQVNAVLNPLLPSDQKIDFCDPIYSNIISDVTDIKTRNPEANASDLMNIIRRLTFKHPDFLKVSDSDIDYRLSKTLFSFRTIKALRNYLEEKVQNKHQG